MIDAISDRRNCETLEYNDAISCLGDRRADSNPSVVCCAQYSLFEEYSEISVEISVENLVVLLVSFGVLLFIHIAY
jgi:hypothetical protein